MNEYISREMVLGLITARKRYLDDARENSSLTELSEIDGYEKALDVLKEDLQEINAADVMPVKHGKWEETHISLVKYIPEDEKEEGHLFYMAELKCSCCERYNAVTYALTLNKPDFCQLCGARMDGDAECQ